MTDKIFHHDHHKHDKSAADTQGDQTSKPKAESGLEKVKDYVKEDEAEEQKGNTYGGLM